MGNSGSSSSTSRAMGNSGSSSLAGTAINVVAAAGAAALGLGAWSFVSAAGAAALGLGALSFASSSPSPSVDPHGQKQQQRPVATATAQQIYLQQEQEDPKPVSNCYCLIQDKVKEGEGFEPAPAPALNIQRQDIKSKAANTSTHGQEQQKSAAMGEQVDLQLQLRLEEFWLSLINDNHQTFNDNHQTLNLNNYRIPRSPKPDPCLQGKAKVGEGTPSSQRKVQHQHQHHQISRRKNRKNKAITTRTIKIMSYNILSLSHVKLHERMKAIDQLIQQHSPDIILFQEVSTLTYEIFQNCNWWGIYSCSVPSENAIGQFCMLLSKLPVKKFFDNQFENTTTGRGLYVARISTGVKKKKLVVATCHLKRPSPPDMNSTQRVSNAKEALKHLHPAPNVVLGGDMNWDESSDGPFPLFGRWCDAWSTLRPEENGWTYDTKSNGMINRKRSLQRRLDRFICKLKDFKIIGIDMIGTEAIPGISYERNGKMLPVLPSDHYGLILTICSKW